MFAAIGIVLLLVMVFGGFIIAGGKMDVLAHALPLEMMIIGGAALGATIVGNNGRELKALSGETLGGRSLASSGDRVIAAAQRGVADLPIAGRGISVWPAD